MTKISAPAAWDLTTGSANTVVAIIDTGINYNHQDLAANIWTNAGETNNNGIDDDGNGFVDDYYGYDFRYNDSDPLDENGHGTHTAGTGRRNRQQRSRRRRR
jgi:subtilisin family serine protease